MPRAVAINVAANSTLPGVRGPIRPDGSFAYVPIPEREPLDPQARSSVPTYADLDLPVAVPAEYRDAAVHLDPSFAGVHGSTAYTYGDEHGVKATPLLSLSAGDLVCFYATLDTLEHGAGPAAPPRPLPEGVSQPDGVDGGEATDWRPPRWGAFVIGGFRLDRDPVPGGEFEALPATDRRRLSENAHRKRAEPDAEVLLLGDPERSALLDAALPLSSPAGGAQAGPIVTGLSEDSGAGPWWRRPLRFDAAATERLLSCLETLQA